MHFNPPFKVTPAAQKLEAILNALKCCTLSKDIAKGKALHAEAIQCDLSSNIYIINSLITMYSRCNSLYEARKLFNEKYTHLTVVSWNALLTGYVEEGDVSSALKLFYEMHQEGCKPNHRTFVAVLKACLRETDGVCTWKSLQRGMELQTQASEYELDKDVFVASSLVELYARYGKVTEAQRVFNEVKHPDLVLWTALITAYSDNRQGEAALDLFFLMQERGLSPDARAFVAAAKACTSVVTMEEAGNNGVKLAMLEKAMNIHSLAVNSRCVFDEYLSTTFVDMYGRAGDIKCARGIFDRMSKHNVVAWNVLLSGYVENGEFELCLELFNLMTVDPDAWTYTATFKACGALAKREEESQRGVNLSWLWKGMEMHSRAARAGHETDLFVASSLINMYSSFACLVDARTVFDRLPHHNLVVWNSLLAGLVEDGEPELALELFRTMPPRKDSCTFIAALKACSSLAGREEGTVVEGKALKVRCLGEGRWVLAELVELRVRLSLSCMNTLIDMFVKAGSMVDARKTFERLPCHNLVSWNMLIFGYEAQGEKELALETFQRMCKA